jgi:hypothetical protein
VETYHCQTVIRAQTSQMTNYKADVVSTVVNHLRKAVQGDAILSLIPNRKKEGGGHGFSVSTTVQQALMISCLLNCHSFQTAMDFLQVAVDGTPTFVNYYHLSVLSPFLPQMTLTGK